MQVEGFPCVLTEGRSEDEGQTVFRGEDHRDLEGAGGRRAGGGPERRQADARGRAVKKMVAPALSDGPAGYCSYTVRWRAIGQSRIATTGCSGNGSRHWPRHILDTAI